LQLIDLYISPGVNAFLKVAERSQAAKPTARLVADVVGRLSIGATRSDGQRG
jgi:hypothetical protein